MRLIDADALTAHLHDTTFVDGDDRSIVYRVIDTEITIDPVKVKHGKWIVKEKVYPDLPNDSDFRYECSLCGWEDQHNEKMIVPYCWHCGARME